MRKRKHVQGSITVNFQAFRVFLSDGLKVFEKAHPKRLTWLVYLSPQCISKIKAIEIKNKVRRFNIQKNKKKHTQNQFEKKKKNLDVIKNYENKKRF